VRPWRGLVGAMVAAALVAASSALAWAAFNSSASASASYATATLAAPTGLTASNGPCTATVNASVTLNWTATTSTWADGYEVLRSLLSGGPYSSVATVSGVSTTTYTDARLLFLTPYYYVVKATKNS